MTWQNFYLTCFLAGMLLTAASFVFRGHLHLPLHLHLPHFNMQSVVIFVTWFGAAGYLMTHYSSAAGMALLAATLVGLVGGTLMYVYLARILSAQEEPLLTADFDMTLYHAAASGRLTKVDSASDPKDHGDEQIGFGRSKTELHQVCLARGLNPAEFVVRWVDRGADDDADLAF